MRETFSTFFGDQPHEFQLEVAKSLLNGQSVILRAPTGSGKTRAALFPFLYAQEIKALFPRQMLYSLPLRVLANSLFKMTERSVSSHKVKLQTGETPDDPQFLAGDVIFATYDQTLTSFLHFPLSLGKRQANVNAGAIVSSYLVFDEIHLMDMQRAFGTMAEILRMLRITTPFLLMTATMTDSTIQWLCAHTGATLIELAPTEVDGLPKPRTWSWVEQAISAEAVCKAHTGKTIVVLNQVERAQDLCRELEKRKEEPDSPLAQTELLLLHSRFISEDRKSKSELVEKWLGKESYGTDCIVIATQVIEVGLDISCKNLHTELAPANSLVQRAGRCARFSGETGAVSVYAVPEGANNPYLPYEAKLCTATQMALPVVCRSDNAREGGSVGYPEELAFVRTVHEEPDREAIEALEASDRKTAVRETIEHLDLSRYRELVRDIDAQSVIVYDAPGSEVKPFELEAFSISEKVLFGLFNKVNKASAEIFAWYPEEDTPNGLSDEEEYKKTTYVWRPVNSEEDIQKAMQIALNPAFAKYDTMLGLCLNLPGAYQSKPMKGRPSIQQFGYERETYEEHISKVWRSYETHFAKRGRLDYTLQKLAESLELEPSVLTNLIKFVIACHDAAKLTEKWQAQINAYQIAIGAISAKSGEFIAHSDYDPKNEAHRQANKKYKKPHHAVEGAVATFAAVVNYIVSVVPAAARGKVMRAYFAAISTHHSPQASKCTEQKLMPGAQKEIRRVAHTVTGLSLPPDFAILIKADIPAAEHHEKFPKPQDGDVFLLTLVLMRVLRIADQHSFEVK